MSKKENWVNIFCSIHDYEMLFLDSFQYKSDNLPLHYKYAGIDFEKKNVCPKIFWPKTDCFISEAQPHRLFFYFEKRGITQF